MDAKAVVEITLTAMVSCSECGVKVKARGNTVPHFERIREKINETGVCPRCYEKQRQVALDKLMVRCKGCSQEYKKFGRIPEHLHKQRQQIKETGFCCECKPATGVFKLLESGKVVRLQGVKGEKRGKVFENAKLLCSYAISPDPENPTEMWNGPIRIFVGDKVEIIAHAGDDFYSVKKALRKPNCYATFLVHRRFFDIGRKPTLQTELQRMIGAV